MLDNLGKEDLMSSFQKQYKENSAFISHYKALNKYLIEKACLSGVVFDNGKFVEDEDAYIYLFNFSAEGRFIGDGDGYLLSEDCGCKYITKEVYENHITAFNEKNWSYFIEESELLDDRGLFCKQMTTGGRVHENGFSFRYNNINNNGFGDYRKGSGFYIAKVKKSKSPKIKNSGVDEVLSVPASIEKDSNDTFNLIKEFHETGYATHMYGYWNVKGD